MLAEGPFRWPPFGLQVAQLRPFACGRNQNGYASLSGAINRRNSDENTHNCLGRYRGLCPRNRRHCKRGHARRQTYRGSIRPAPSARWSRTRPWARAWASRPPPWLARQSRPASWLVRWAPSRLVAFPASPSSVKWRIDTRPNGLPCRFGRRDLQIIHQTLSRFPGQRDGLQCCVQRPPSLRPDGGF